MDFDPVSGRLYLAETNFGIGVQRIVFPVLTVVSVLGIVAGARLAGERRARTKLSI